MAELWPGLHGPVIDYISAPPSETWRRTRPRTLVILGSTGSIGRSALAVVDSHPDFFSIKGLSCARQVDLLAAQALRYRPPFLAVLDDAAAADLQQRLPADYKPEILTGPQGYARLAGLDEASTVLSAQVGAAGLAGTLAAALAGKVICLANKESLVLAGGIVRDICARTGAVVLPVDSEHNAVFQCLAGRGQDVVNIILTASGGPFRGMSRSELSHVSMDQALHHPNWRMGAKISIDSATLMNKGLEVMEAFQLYGLAPERIKVLVHPQSVVHSLVELKDGSLLAQMGTPDMRMAIAHCLLWPHCAPAGVAPLNLVTAGPLTFEEPDTVTFPCLALARAALERRGGSCIALNAANEAAVELFLQKKCSFTDIDSLIASAISAHLDTEPCRGPLCPPLSTPLTATDPLALRQEVHTLVERIEHLDHQCRRHVRQHCGGSGSA